MAIGLGVVLLVAGLILTLDVVTVHMSYINVDTLGGILIAAGILAILLSLIVNAQRSRRTTVVQDDRPVEGRRIR
ncbi:MAG: hypothetical protein JWQ32_3387 [Marmoricola sp.]|nr:hypothetical protein [Marmoricola sp.]